MFGLESWPGELAASWRPHVAIGVLVVAVLCLAFSRRWMAGLLVAVALTLGADVLWSGLVSAQTEAGAIRTDEAPMARVMFANVLRSNPDLADLMDWVAEQDPDVLVLTEVVPGHVEEIAGAMEGYGYQVLEPRHHAFGMTIYSRFPIADHQFAMLTTDTLSEGGPITLVARIETEQGVLAVAGVHPFPPANVASMIARNRQLEAAVDLLWDIEEPLVVVGDYNATPWSPALRQFAEELDLHGFNIAATWPVWIGFTGIPIDHALISNELLFSRIEVGPNIGSDHRPIVIDVVLESPTADQGSPGTP
jgi:endonuclease/exonuclease/phosphatase (EEP) superfamily protein YafD